MEIIVKGIGEINVKPNLIKLTFNFNLKEKSYDGAIKNGIKNVESYILLLTKLGFNKEDIKTNSFRLSENKEYNEKTRTYVSNGYLYYQCVNLEFDYDMSKLSEIIDKTSKFNNGPSYTINFTIKNDKKLEEELLDDAYKNAEFQAKAIAKSCGKDKTLNCKKISFQPFDESFYSPTSFDRIKMADYDSSIGESLQNVFVPENIQVQKEIYCLFEAE